ncbi:predicted protein [Histoplasma capsulatum var. duboisii H88]|uniref:Predicted protein n=1 Tax=Ajellomyces capsulatus (strain H88) TaxID=544711 RepID=F0U767_AJEC8|nr:predicted protein [Histoplasma capsulatum var. duboisii H88]
MSTADGGHPGTPEAFLPLVFKLRGSGADDQVQMIRCRHRTHVDKSSLRLKMRQAPAWTFGQAHRHVIVLDLEMSHTPLGGTLNEGTARSVGWGGCRQPPTPQ